MPKKLPAYKKSKKNSSVKINKKYMAILIITLSFILVAILIAISLELNIIKNPIKGFQIAPELFIIKDKCSLIVGQIIHTINDESICKMKCNAECEVREMQFRSSEFTKKEGDCHECRCYCK